MKKNPLLIFILVFLTFSSLVAYGSPLGSVNTQSATVPAPLTQALSSNGIQSKRGGISVVGMTVGDLNASSPSVAKLTTTGKLGLAFTGSAINNNPTEALDVHGAIDIMGPAQEGTSICADNTGALAPCGFLKFNFDGKDCYYSSTTNYTCGTANMNKAFITKEFKVPVGITNITVELWGAGGAGYGINNSISNNSPDADVNYSSTCSNGSAYDCIIGGSAYLLDAVNSVVLRAKGGYGATSSHTGANGGGYTISSGSITDLGSISGGAGGDGSSTTGTSSTGSFFCGTTSYTYKIPNNGGDGGVGGKSGYGSTTPGGRGGHGGSNLGQLINTYGLTYFCNNSPTDILSGLRYYGENGIDGSYGNGGSGSGGKGGDADKSKSALCGSSGRPTCNSADIGYSGGGGGGYVNAIVPVTPGTIYKIKLSHGGNAQGKSEDTTIISRSFYDEGSGAKGATSGNGSPSYAQISF